jgi:hypothetical protein
MLETTLQNIINNIDITPSGQIIVKGVPMIASYLFTFNLENKNMEFKKMLSEIIYNQFYCQISDRNQIYIDEVIFFRQLRKANKSKNRIINGFKVIHLDENGSIVVEKGELRKRINNGNYLIEENSHIGLQIGECARVFFQKESYDNENAFYHVFGVVQDIDFSEALIRFYFNLKPEGSPILIDKLCSALNKHKIFFQFKCFKRPQDYIRADSGVLYLYKFDWKRFYPLLKQIFQELKPYLNRETPLFTYFIQDGIAFGENPKDVTKSFGILRCELIAEAIINIQIHNKNKLEWIDSITSYLENNGFRKDAFYLNPRSSYPYPF